MFLVCVFFIYSYVRGHVSDFTSLSEMSTTYLLLIGCVYTIFLAVNGLFLKILTAVFDIDLHFLEFFSISVVTSFGNLLLPMRGGAGLRAVYLKSRYNFAYAYFLASLGATYLLVLSVSSILGLACLVLVYILSGYFSPLVGAIFLTVAVLSSWTAFSPAPNLEWIPLQGVRKRAAKIVSGLDIIRKGERTVLKLASLSALNYFLCSLLTWLEFAAFHARDIQGREIGFLQAAIFSAIGGLSGLISITPAALGIKESILMFSTRFLGISRSQALAVSLIDRSAGILVVCLFFCFASVYMNRRLKLQNAVGLAPEGIEITNTP